MSAYEPGTVAVATVNGKRNVRVFRTGVPSNMGWEFNHTDGKGHGWASDVSAAVTNVRPLVVLDLDLSANIGVRQLLTDLRREKYYDIADQIEAQTRPAITEPTGLGAVVEDADEACWVRADDPKRPWHWGDNRRAWSNLTPVRVLSEGVA